MSALDIAAQIHYTNLSVFSAPKEKTETNVASCCHHSASNSHLKSSAESLAQVVLRVLIVMTTIALMEEHPS
jgi:hypothetical protein